MDDATVQTAQFRDLADRLYGDLVTPQLISDAEEGCFPAALWEATMDAGIGATLVPQAQGGIGATLADAAAILAAAGYHAAPVPVLESMLANAFMAEAGLQATDEPVALAFNRIEGPAGWRAPMRVGWTNAAPRVAVIARAAGAGARLLVAPVASFERAAAVVASGEPCETLRSRQDPGGAEWLALPGLSFDRCLQQAALLRSAQMVGALRWCLERTVAYALERRQFGREIGKFQAVQQMIAELACATVAAAACVDAAVADSANRLLTAAARSRLGDAVDTAVTVAHQVHGAIGFSHEYPLHFRTRRLMTWRDEFGSVADWRDTLAQAFVGRAPDDVWPALVAAG